MHLENTTRALFYISFAGLALFIPFSIAGANFAIGFGILAWLIAVAASRGRHHCISRLKTDAIFWAAVLLIITALFSALTSENSTRGLRDWKSYWLFVIYLITGFTIASRRLRKIVFWVLFFSGTLSALVALIQAGGGIRLLFFNINDKMRPSSTLFTMTFAGIFYQLICLNFSMLLRELKWNRSFFILLAGLLIQVTAFLFNLTRGAWFALFFGLAAVVIFQRKGRTMAAGAAVLCVIVLFAILNPSLNARLRSVVSDIHSPKERSIKTRLILWDISLDLIRDYPLLGAGMGDFSVEADRRLNGRNAKSTSDAHNIYLHVLATRGIFGFIPFLLFWILLFRKLTSLERRLRTRGDPFDRHLVIGALAATVAVLVGAMTENNIDDSEVFIAFLYLIGLARSTEWNGVTGSPNREPARATSRETAS